MNKYLQNLASYISENNPRGVNQVAYKYGYIAPVSQEGREGMIFRGIMEEGENFLKDLARVHPDRELVLNADGSPSTSDATTEPNVINLSNPPLVRASVSASSETIKIAIILVLAFILYKILS